MKEEAYYTVYTKVHQGGTTMENIRFFQTLKSANAYYRKNSWCAEKPEKHLKNNTGKKAN